MTDLTFIHSLTVDSQMRVLERMLADRTPEETARAELRAKSLSPLPATASPSRDALPIPPPGLAVAGNSLSETSPCS